MKAIYKRRLLKLAEHLEKQKLGHKKFNFGVWNGDANGNQCEVNGCGFSGCAIGECPFVFPRSWKWRAGLPRTVAVPPITDKAFWSRDWPVDSALMWFGLTYDALNHLFIPDRQDPGSYGGKILTRLATPKQVARNIRAFVAKRSTETTI